MLESGSRYARFNTICKQGFTKQVYVADAGVIVDIAQNIRQSQPMFQLMCRRISIDTLPLFRASTQCKNDWRTEFEAAMLLKVRSMRNKPIKLTPV
jgi:hypothetical protein